ncbi:hypothetical protein Bhyg_03462 [Pseudolycoriella hygida]|uniref:Uncharacterized protein n=1 Tax=Pseudolycoriella hygida TaxID=35572 RepID=A0A9Q0S9I4_9DIPT|nr:hypothetical protein Bhyg_03462 [Pseudolycoriella hygida]
MEQISDSEFVLEVVKDVPTNSAQMVHFRVYWNVRYPVQKNSRFCTKATTAPTNGKIIHLLHESHLPKERLCVQTFTLTMSIFEKFEQ